MSKVYIDPGHGGSDSGAVGFGRKEKDDVLKIGLEIVRLLKNSDVTTIMSRVDDTEPKLADRISQANREKCDYYISIHRDGFSNSTAKGTSIYVYSAADSGTISKANKIYSEVLKSSEMNGRGLKKGAPNYSDFAVCRDTDMSACLVELGFITNEQDNKLFDANFSDIAESIAKALCSIVGANYGIKTVTNDISLPTIKKGSKGATVTKLQTALNSFGYGLKVDGDFGKLTDKAVRNFQKKMGISVDGIVGPVTWNKLLG